MLLGKTVFSARCVQDFATCGKEVQNECKLYCLLAAVSCACLHATKQELLDTSVGTLCTVQWSDLQNG
jgi:hypothetical protein